MHLHFNHVTILEEDFRITFERWEMADAIVDRDTGRESNTFLHILFSFEDFTRFFRKQSIAFFAQVQDTCSRSTFFHKGFENTCHMEGMKRLKHTCWWPQDHKYHLRFTRSPLVLYKVITMSSAQVRSWSSVAVDMVEIVGSWLIIGTKGWARVVWGKTGASVQREKDG